MKKVIEKITKVCCVWNWCLFKINFFGKKGDYALISKSGKIGDVLGTVSVAIDKNKNIALIKTYRHAIDKLSWELVRGAKEKKLSSVENAIKEFEEEVGITNSSKAEYIGRFAPDGGIIGGYLDYVLLEFDDFTKHNVWGKRNGNYEEIYEIKYFSFLEFESMILNGEIVDGFTLAAYGLLKLNKII